MATNGYDYGKKRRTTANQRRAEWWSVWPWLIMGAVVAVGAVYLAFMK